MTKELKEFIVFEDSTQRQVTKISSTIFGNENYVTLESQVLSKLTEQLQDCDSISLPSKEWLKIAEWIVANIKS